MAITGDVSREVFTCKSCRSLIRRDRSAGWYDIDMNHDTNPEPWSCSGRYTASPLRRHAPMEEDEKLMMTPQENLTEAARLLDVIGKAAEGKPLSVADTIALANSRMTLALALNAVPFLGDVREEFADLRDPRKIT